MIARVKKKFVLGLLVILNLSTTVSANEGKNESVVMKINNMTYNIHPRMMISQHNAKLKERNETNIISNVNTSAEEVNMTEKSQNMSKSNPDEKSESKAPALYFPYNLRIISEILQKLENKECVAATTQVIEAMTRHERWALELFDSFAKFPVGILYGNYYQMGNFDECVGVRKHIEMKDLQGQYCLADIYFKQKNERVERSINLPLKKYRYAFNNSLLHWGICLPSACTTLDSEIFTREIFASSAENFEVVSVSVDPIKCTVNKSPPFTTLEIVYGCIIGCFLIFTILATLVHCCYIQQMRKAAKYSVDTLRHEQSENALKKILICFSIIQTTGKLLQTKSNESNLECICGIKCISMILIIIGHSLVFIFGGPVENKDFFEKELTRVENGPLLNNPLLVDNFLLVSGFLMCRLLLIELERRKGKLNVVIIYAARYIRLTPVYLIVIGFYTTFLHRTASGPFWESRVGLERDRCLNSWWTNILYINNYVNSDQLCMFQSWYLSVDYHLFIIAPIIIYPLWRWRKIGEIILVACTLISGAIPLWITYMKNLDPTLLAYPSELEDISTNFYYMNAYIKTHMRSSSYCIGIFLGYLVHRLQSSGIKMRPSILTLGSILATLLGTVSMYSIVIFFDPGHTENMIENAVYASLHRIGWSLAIGWVILICVTDHAGIVNKFLSYRAFIPLSRLTYCAYLANGIIEIYNMGNLRFFFQANKCLAHVLLTYSMAFVLCIIFESPIHGLEKILLTKHKVKELREISSLRPLEGT
nr:nose resistant to fluoxetine protein 6-like isoform X2 [Leptinotarsa decemlineata]